jgi:hypothetical protein
LIVKVVCRENAIGEIQRLAANERIIEQIKGVDGDGRGVSLASDHPLLGEVEDFERGRRHSSEEREVKAPVLARPGFFDDPPGDRAVVGHLDDLQILRRAGLGPGLVELARGGERGVADLLQSRRLAGSTAKLASDVSELSW